MERKSLKIISWIPKYSVIPLISGFLLNTLIYEGVMFFIKGRHQFDFTTNLDRAIPLVPSFVVIYLGCYIFWVFNYLLIAKQGKEHFYRFQVADLTSRFICLFFFLVIPTTNIRPELSLDGWADYALAFVWNIDPPMNLFPSIHCLVSWFCYIGIRGQKTIPKWYQRVSLIFAILVFLSTQFTKQHYWIDVVGGVVIAELTYYLGRKTNLYHINAAFFEKLNQMLKIERGGDYNWDENKSKHDF